MRGTGNAPEDVGGLGVVPGCGFRDYAGCFRRGGEVCAYIMKTLGGGAYCSGLKEVSGHLR